MYLEIGKIQVYTNNMDKKLYRESGCIGGVCKGLATWSGVPPALWRIIFIFGLPWMTFWIYILMWIFVERKQ